MISDGMIFSDVIMIGKDSRIDVERFLTTMSGTLFGWLAVCLKLDQYETMDGTVGLLGRFSAALVTVICESVDLLIC